MEVRGSERLPKFHVSPILQTGFFAESFIRNEKENPSGFLPEEVCIYMDLVRLSYFSTMEQCFPLTTFQHKPNFEKVAQANKVSAEPAMAVGAALA